MENLAKLLDFVELTNAFRRVERDIPSSEGAVRENDSEHSYQLAMVSWYLATAENINLDVNKVLKYAIVHDLAEAYAGDTPLYTSDGAYFDGKKEREARAILKLREDFPDFGDLHEWIEKYEAREDEESKFVFAVDKLLPIMAIYLDNGHAWKTHKIQLESIVEKNEKRISISPIVKEYFDLMLKAIKDRPELLGEGVKVFKKAISFNGERCDVQHVEADNFDDIPDGLKQKAHAVCFYGGKMLLVNHPEWDIWSIPGGTRDPGEVIEETLARELVEETNCKVIDLRPIAYQNIVGPRGDVYYCRLQYLCNVVPLGEFTGDPAGNVDKIAWIQPNDFEKYIENKEFKRLVIRRALELLRAEGSL